MTGELGDFTTFDPYGSHRVLEPGRALPQEAHRLDPRPTIAPNEVLAAVDRLNLDAASFLQLRAECGDERGAIGRRVAEIVAERGKMHNPVTGSGGVFCGSILETGPAHPRSEEIAALRSGVLHSASPEGLRIASLVSLTLTPLRLEEVGAVDLATGQIEVRGTAVLFAASAFALLPRDLPEPLALAVLDVAGAPAHTRRLARTGDTVLILGAGGRAGLLCQQAASRAVGPLGHIVAWCHPAAAATRAERLAQDHRCRTTVLAGDAANSLATSAAISHATDGGLADLTINCVSAPGTEMASILATRSGGTILFFGMATDFARAALGAEGVGKDVRMLIGNGYAEGHAEEALDLVRLSATLRELFAGP